MSATNIDHGSVNSSPTRRTPHGVLIRPRQQFKYAFILVAGGVLAQSLIIGVVAYFMSASVAGVINENHLNPEVGQAISQAISISLTILMLVAAGFALIAMLIGVKLSHRIYGPLVPFTRHIQHLKDGNYSVRMNLRKRDDMVELKDALNSLAAVLEERYPGAAGVTHKVR